MRIQHIVLALCLLAPLGTAQVVGELRIAEGESGFTANLKNGWHFGSDVASLGDVNGDGVGDMAVGCPMDDSVGPGVGSVFVLLLQPDGTVGSFVKIGSGLGGFTGTLATGAFFGSSVAGLGDLDGDGVCDLAVGSDGDSAAGFRTGALWILFLKADGTVKSNLRIGEGAGGFVGTLDDNDLFGCSAGLVGDIDLDGVMELAVGARGDDDGMPDAGAVYLLSVDATGVVDQSKISATSGGLVFLFKGGEAFGGGVGALDDLDGDGVLDLAVGMPGYDTGTSAKDQDAGAIQVLFLNADRTVRQAVLLAKNMNGFNTTTDNAEFGEAIVRGDDYDGDGIRDLVGGGAAWQASSGILPGSVWILYMNEDGTSHGFLQISTNPVGFVGPLFSGDQFGSGLALLDDLDGNGTQDLAVGALGTDVGGLDTGAVWILSLRQGIPVTASFAERTGVGNLAMAFQIVTSGSFTPPIIGGQVRLQVDTSLGTGKDEALFFAFDTQVTIPLPAGYTLLTVDGGGGLGELLTGGGLLVAANPNNQFARYTLNIPLDGNLVGFSFSVQSILIDSTGANPFELSDAWDMTIGL